MCSPLRESRYAGYLCVPIRTYSVAWSLCRPDACFYQPRIPTDTLFCQSSRARTGQSGRKAPTCSGEIECTGIVELYFGANTQFGVGGVICITAVVPKDCVNEAYLQIRCR